MAKSHEPIRARLVADLRPALEDWNDPVAVGVGFDGAIYAAARQSRSALGVPADCLVILFGDYEQRSRALLVELGRDGVARVTDETTLVDDGGKPLDQAHAFGVGRDLYFVENRRVLVADDW